MRLSGADLKTNPRRPKEACRSGQAIRGHDITLILSCCSRIRPPYLAQLEKEILMRRMFLAVFAMGGLTALSAFAAAAAPSPGLHPAQSHSMVSQVDYEWHHRHWHHRHWEHGHWRYWN
jgi:hypothetical protein